MRWQRGRSSGNVIDVRGSSMPGGLGLGVLVFLAFQLLGGGGAALAVPSAFGRRHLGA